MPPADFDPSATVPSLSGAAVRGGVAIAGAQVLQQVLRVGFSVMLARLLTPRDFGLVAVVALFTGFASLLTDLGMGSALVQIERVGTGELSTAFWTTALLGVALSAGLVAGAPAVAWIFDEEALVPVTRGLAPVLTLSALATVPKATLTRRLRFRAVATTELAASIVAGSAGVALALVGFGVTAIIAQALLAPAIVAGALFVVATPSIGRPTRGGFAQLWSFSGGLTAYTVINFWARQGDNFLIGKVLGPAALGIYSRAYSLMLFPVTHVTHVLGRVIFPVLSRIREDDERVRRAYLRAIGVISLVTFPGMVVVIAAGEPLVLALLGERWAAVAPVLRVLAVAGLLQTIGATSGWLFMACGATRQMFRFSVVANAAVFASFLIGLRWGILGVASAYVITSTVLGPVSLAIPGRLIGLRLRDIWRSLRDVSIASIAVLIVALISNESTTSWDPVMSLAITVSVSIGTYAASLAILRPLALVDAVGVFRSIRQDRPRST